MMLNAWPSGEPTSVAAPVPRLRVASCALLGSKVLVIVYLTPPGGQGASASEKGNPVSPITLTLLASRLKVTSLVPASAVA